MVQRKIKNIFGKILNKLGYRIIKKSDKIFFTYDMEGEFKELYNKCKNYGILGNFTTKDITAVIDELMQKGYLERAGDFMYPTVNVSREGGVAILKKEKIGLEILSQIKEPREKEQKEKKQQEEAEEPLTPDEVELFEKLRNWRNQS